MKIYWDTSALLWYYGQGRIEEIAGVTRTHSLAEAFSALSGAGIHVGGGRILDAGCWILVAGGRAGRTGYEPVAFGNLPKP